MRRSNPNTDGRWGALWAGMGALLCGLMVILAALGDHWVAGTVNAKSLEIYHLANRFQFYSGVGLLLLGLATSQWGRRPSWTISGVLLLIGVLCFSGGLYLVALLGQSWAIFAPIGGSSLIVAWLLFAFGLWRAALRAGEGSTARPKPDEP